MMKFFTVCLTFLLLGPASYSQITGYLYGLNNTSPGVWNFSRIEIATGSFTNLQPLPLTSFNSNYSSCVDADQQIYYLCTAKNLLGIDPQNGNIISDDTLLLSQNASFLYVQYNPCDSNIYGVINDYPTSISFARYNLQTDSLTILAPITATQSFCGGCMSLIDTDSNYYVLQTGGQLLGLDLTTGQLRFLTAIVNVPQEQFGHIALLCHTNRIIGTSANTGEGLKYLSEVNPHTGTVTHISENGWTPGVWKPMGGGNCIDQGTGMYFYSGQANAVIGASTASGNMVHHHTTPTGENYFLQHFSQCACEATNPLSLPLWEAAVTVYPNPFSDYIEVEPGEYASVIIMLYDIAGKPVLSSSQLKTETTGLAPGTYLYKVFDAANGLQTKSGKLIRQ